MTNPLWTWINERHAIYLRRRVVEGHAQAAHTLGAWGHGKWRPGYFTDDPVLQRYAFCNVFRELDRVTAWIRREWREPYRAHTSVFGAMALARCLNWPPTLGELGYPLTWDPDRLYRVLLARRARGDKVYTGAYILRGDVERVRPNMPADNNKPHYTIYTMVDPLLAALPDFIRTAWPGGPQGMTVPTLQAVWEWMAQYHGWGSSGFMSYEVVTDLRHTDWLNRAADIYTWANAGPGAIRGLNRLAGRPLSKRGFDPLEEMRALLAEANAGALAPWVPMLEMRDIEHSLCETDKYLRVIAGEGRPRAMFRPNRPWE